MRIIAGKYRGLKLNAPKNDRIRPTTDRIKEDLFNIIQNHVPDSAFLDLFSGSGAIGLEAISRGAENADLVEHDRDAIKLIQSNIKKIKDPKPLRLIQKNVEQFVHTTSNKYDIIFMDPPYRYEYVMDLLTTINKRELLKSNGILVLEQGTDQDYPPEQLNKIGFQIDKAKRYSSTVLYIISNRLS